MVDFVVTSKAKDKGDFAKKLERLENQGVISGVLVTIVAAAFDASNAAAHRRHSPWSEDLNLLSEVAESLVE